MFEESLLVTPGPDDQSVRTAAGAILRAPPDWMLLPPGDATLTRRVKASCVTWTVQEKRGRKTFSHGIWAPHATIEAVQAALATERSSPTYAKQRESGLRRRERQQASYVDDFQQAVLGYLAFAARYQHLAERLAQAVTTHATPVGSGTVARTKRIPIEQRAEAAVIAWLRHQTTAYDNMVIPRVKGKRRETRRLLARQSHKLLDGYRTGADVDSASCPLQRALSGAGEA